MLTFKNPKLTSNLGEVLYDSPFIHIDVDAEFYLFRPSVGCCVKGFINLYSLIELVTIFFYCTLFDRIYNYIMLLNLQA